MATRPFSILGNPDRNNRGQSSPERKKPQVAAFLAGVILWACGTAAPPNPRPAPRSATAEASPTTTVPVMTTQPATSAKTPAFRTAAALDHVRTLATDIGLRNAGSPGDSRAAEFIAGRMRESGLDVRLQEFTLPQGGTSRNVIGTPPSYKPGLPYLLVGGHFDSLNGPGANDNATGIGVMLEIAASLRDAPLPVVFVAFGAEEIQPVPERAHHLGSRHYVEFMTPSDRDTLQAMLNLDMIGRGDFLIAGRLRSGSLEATKRLVRLALIDEIPLQERITPDWSDHGTFTKAGMNAGWLWSGQDPSAMHSRRDTFDRVQSASVERAGRLTTVFLRSYAH